MTNILLAILIVVVVAGFIEAFIRGRREYHKEQNDHRAFAQTILCLIKGIEVMKTKQDVLNSVTNLETATTAVEGTSDQTNVVGRIDAVTGRLQALVPAADPSPRPPTTTPSV